MHEKAPKNTASTAIMPLFPEVKEFLLNFKAYQTRCSAILGKKHKGDHIVRRSDGAKIDLNYLNNRLQKTLNRIDEPIVTLHELRHSTAILLRSLGYPDNVIMSWLRHADIQSTMHYAHDNMRVKMIAVGPMRQLFLENPGESENGILPFEFSSNGVATNPLAATN
jgi:integrase